MPRRSLNRLIVAGMVVLAALLWRWWEKRIDENRHHMPPSTEQPRDESVVDSIVGDSSVSETSTVAAFDLPYGGQGITIDNGCYVISYVEAFEQPEWTSYVLDGRAALKIKREDHAFQEDKTIKTGSAGLGDYRNSGYDRGHLVPAADMKVSLECYGKSFLLSNVSPQVHEFNTGLWRRLEESVRKWAKKKTPMQIISGPILKKGLKKSIGKENTIPVPEEYYKIIVHQGPKGYKAIGFLMPNRDSELSVEKFAVSVRQVEHRTGLDFNRALPDSVEKAVDNNLDLKYWFN